MSDSPISKFRLTFFALGFTILAEWMYTWSFYARAIAW
jgi:hypothetical protein